MKSTSKRVWMMLIILLLIITGTMHCGLAEQTSGTINYAVKAILPENQLNPSVSYFDLLMAPGQRQVLQVVVKNKGDKAIEVAVEANTAFSNSNGVIEFDVSDERDASMAVDFAQVVTPVQSVIEIPAYSEGIAEFSVQMPDTPYEGVVFGGLMFTKLHQGEDNEAGSISIRNIYRYVIGVRLYESEEKVEPMFELLAAEQGNVSLPSLALHFRNPQPVIARGILLHVEVSPKDGDEVLLAFTRENVAMAPNSTMLYQHYLNGDAATLESGEYSLKATMVFEETQWDFEVPLVID